VPEWPFPPRVDLEVIEGDHEVASGVSVVATPGHTPGHQSVLIEDRSGARTIVCCQASWNGGSFEAATVGDEGWDAAAGVASLKKPRALDPDRLLLSHDSNEWQPRR
jgi:N-acyl homoserine lactone hydrolase